MSNPDDLRNDVVRDEAKPTPVSDQPCRWRFEITRKSDGKVVTGVKRTPLRFVPPSKANALAYWNKLKEGKATPKTLAPIVGEHCIMYTVGRYTVSETLVGTFIMLLPESEHEDAAQFFQKWGMQFKLAPIVDPPRKRRTRSRPKTVQAACRRIFMRLAKTDSVKGVLRMNVADERCIPVTLGDDTYLVPVACFVDHLTAKQQIKARGVFHKYL